MAALDFGMALARGLLPKAEKAQKDLLDLAGGRNIFKSEEWWNEQVDKQLDKGYRESSEKTRYLTETGQYKDPGTQLIQGRVMYGQFQPTGIIQQTGTPYRVSYKQAPGMGGGAMTRVSDILPKGAVMKQDAPVSKEFTVFDKDSTKYFTEGELSDIESESKAGLQRVKREAATLKASRKKRGTGGMLAKAVTPGSVPATGLPALGEGGLGIVESILGGGIKI